jgi:protoporphyrinogen oxidase
MTPTRNPEWSFEPGGSPPESNTTAPAMKSEVVVIGAGITGLSAAMELGDRCRVFEKAAGPGGLAVSETIDGYTFDRTGHWLHLRDAEVEAAAESWLPDGWLQVERKSRAYSRGVLTGYPFQVHLHGHEPELVWECLVELWNARCGRYAEADPSVANFEDFILDSFGAGIGRHFLIPYNEKLWGVHPREMTSDWCQRFVPVPSVEEILAGAVGAEIGEVGYNVRFRYPKDGGIGELTRAMADQLDPSIISYSSPVERVDVGRRRAKIGDEWVGYHRLISTMPLVELCRLLAEPPKEVVDYASKLRWSQVDYLDVATHPAVQPGYHWVYLPDRDHPAYRVGIYSNAAPHMAPANGSSLYVELAGRDRYQDVTGAMAEVTPALAQMGMIGSADDIRFARLRTIPYAYVIYDHDYVQSRRFLLRFFERHGIYSCGRYGSWIYSSMEDNIIEGRRVARAILERGAS